MQKDERKFQDVVDTIDKAEQDVDKVLDAARLERKEGADRHMTGTQKFYLLLALIGAASIISFFSLIAFSF